MTEDKRSPLRQGKAFSEWGLLKALPQEKATQWKFSHPDREPHVWVWPLSIFHSSPAIPSPPLPFLFPPSPPLTLFLMLRGARSNLGQTHLGYSTWTPRLLSWNCLPWLVPPSETQSNCSTYFIILFFDLIFDVFSSQLNNVVLQLIFPFVAEGDYTWQLEATLAFGMRSFVLIPFPSTNSYTSWRFG